MPDITIIKLKIRRGSDAQRKSVILEQGELGYTIDTQRVFVGNGVLSGGNVVGNVVHPPLLLANTRINQVDAVKGDLVYDNSVLWQLTGSSYSDINAWVSLNTRGDGVFITTDANNKLTLNSNSLAYSQGGISSNTNGISANVDGTYIAISSNKITINTVDQNKITSSALGKGLQGGSGTVISVNADGSSFGYYGNTLTLTAVPANTVSVNSLSSGFVGNGLVVTGNSLNTVVQTYDVDSFDVDVNTLRLKNLISPSTTTLTKITYNEYGQIVNTSSNIVETLTGNNNGILSAFNGYWDQSKLTNQTLVTAVSGSNNGTTAAITLTSAGFMSIETDLGVFAIPIFNYNY